MSDLAAPGNVPGITLDTNVVLDWLVFREPSVAAVVDAIERGRVRWLACPSMRAELARTLGYDNLQRWQPDREYALAQFDKHAVLFEQPPTLPLLRCRDADDQVFLDLAVARSARWLLTHDRALLSLARRARALGVQITKPAAWQR